MPFKFIGLPRLSVTVIRISDIVVLVTGLSKALLGSKLNGHDLVRLSVGITARVLPCVPSVKLSEIMSQLMLTESILLVILEGGPKGGPDGGPEGGPDWGSTFCTVPLV